MKILICGSRYWIHAGAVLDTLQKVFADHDLGDIEVIHGNCRGADRLAASIAKRLGATVTAFPADWSRYGRAAGMKRNEQMLAERPDLVIAFHENLNQSKGTAHMVRIAQRAGIETQVYTP